MSVARAHEAHRKARTELEQGCDPGTKAVQERREERHAPTVAMLAAEYLEKWVKKRNRSAPEIERILNKDVLPKWGHRKARDITRREVIALLDGVAERGPIMANQTLAVIRKMFNFGADRAILETSPCLRVKAPGPLKQRERVLNEEEIQALWNGLDKAAMAPGTRLALKLQLATAQRKGKWRSCGGIKSIGTRQPGPYREKPLKTGKFIACPFPAWRLIYSNKPLSLRPVRCGFSQSTPRGRRAGWRNRR